MDLLFQEEILPKIWRFRNLHQRREMAGERRDGRKRREEAEEESARRGALRRKSCYSVPTKRGAQVLPRYPRYLLIYLIRPTGGPRGPWSFEESRLIS